MVPPGVECTSWLPDRTGVCGGCSPRRDDCCGGVTELPTAPLMVYLPDLASREGVDAPIIDLPISSSFSRVGFCLSDVVGLRYGVCRESRLRVSATGVGAGDAPYKSAAITIKSAQSSGGGYK